MDFSNMQVKNIPRITYLDHEQVNINRSVIIKNSKCRIDV